MKIIGVTTVGTYKAWGAWTVASMYHVCDEIVVINGGYDITDLSRGDSVPLERELKQLKELDVDNKVVQIKPDWNSKFSNKDRDEAGRGRNITLAFQYAYSRGADWILKADSDQVFTEQLKRSSLEKLTDKLAKGFRFAQYADWFRNFEHVDNMPDDFTNDGTLFFKASPDAWAVAQGSPVVGDQHPVYDEEFRTHHLRRTSPPDLSEYDYHFNRLWYHTYAPCLIGEHPFVKKHGRQPTKEEIEDIAGREAKSIISRTGTPVKLVDDERCPKIPPKVVSYKHNKLSEYVNFMKNTEADMNR